MEPLPTRIYTPDSGLRDPVGLLREMFEDLLRSRELAWRLAVRDICAQYRQAALGILWAFVLPVTNSLVWLFLHHTGTVRMAETMLPYGAYVFAGTILWAILTDAVAAPLQQATAAKSMLVKVNFPREALVLSGIYQTLFNTGIRIAVLLAALVTMGVYPDWGLLLFPFAVLALIVAGTAVGLLVTPIGLLYRDVGKGLPLLMQFLMYLSPVVFPMPPGGIAARVFEGNPMTPLIGAGRDWLTGGTTANVSTFILVNLAFLLLLLAVGIVYRLAMPILIERLGS